MSEPEKELYRNRFFKNTNADKDVGGLYVKLPFMDCFSLVYDVHPIDEGENVLKITVNAIPAAVLPPGPALDSFKAGEHCAVNYFIQASQAVFMTVERHSAS